MKYDPQKHHRRSIRLPEYDYSQEGAYFVTICTWGREPLFGEIYGGVMRLSAAGRIVKAEWNRLAHQFANIHLNAFVVMPNHVHGIIVIHGSVGATRHSPIETLSGIEPVPNDAMDCQDGSPVQDGGGDSVGATHHTQIGTLFGNEPASKDAPAGPAGSPVLAKGSLGAMIGQFKSRATKRIWSLPEYDHVPVWQRNYYEHIIRNDAEWERIYEYIQNNPVRWEEDQLHPNAPNNPFNQD